MFKRALHEEPSERTHDIFCKSLWRPVFLIQSNLGTAVDGPTSPRLQSYYRDVDFKASSGINAKGFLASLRQFSHIVCLAT